MQFFVFSVLKDSFADIKISADGGSDRDQIKCYGLGKYSYIFMFRLYFFM